MSGKNITEIQEEEVIIGARALGDQIYKIMPTYQVLLKQLEGIRKSAKELEGNEINQNMRKQDINNTIGIFGARGTGKSSALYTLRQDLNQSEYNILLPLIEPDNFGENTKIIGSIVGFLQAEGNELLKSLEKQNLDQTQQRKLSTYFNNGTVKPNNLLKQIINKTVEYHLYTESQYRNMLSHHYEDLATHIKKSSRLLIPDIAFKNKLNELICEIVHVKKVLGKSEDPVLIYIFIDDIDLKTSKTRELMDALLQYTNHPNIVTVLSGDYDILTESLTLALLADEPLKEVGLSAYDSLKSLGESIVETNKAGNDNPPREEYLLTILGRKAGLAHEYLKKVIPSARRHQLVKWSEETIPYFAFGQATLMSQLAKLMGEQSIFSYTELREVFENDKEVERKVTLPIKKSYTIFDERPRGIVYAYYNLVQLLKVKESKSSEEEKFRFVKVFVDTLIFSSNKLLRFQEMIFEQFLLWGSDAKSSYIDYSVDFSRKNDLDLELVIIGEITTYLLPDVKYDTGAFGYVKERLFSRLLLSKSDQKNNESYKFDRYSWNTPRLYQMMSGLVLNTDLRSAMLMLEYMSESLFDSYYYQYMHDAERYQKDRFVVFNVEKLIRQYPGIIEQLYRESLIAKQITANYTLNTLQDLCTVNPDFEMTERIFQGVFRNFVPNDPKNNLKQYEDFNIKKNLFTNNLTMIRKEEQPVLERRGGSHDLKVTFAIISSDKFSGLARALTRLNKRLSTAKEHKLPESVLQTIENSMDKFGEYLYKKLTDEDINTLIRIDEKGSQVLDEYFRGEAGINTIYGRCKHIVYKRLTGKEEFFDYRIDRDEYIVNFQIFKEIISQVESLAQNNRVWFGQTEAINLLIMLRSSSFIADNIEERNHLFFTGNDEFILEQYYKFTTSNQEFLEDKEYENAKKFIKEHMDAAYEKVRNQTQTELEEYNLSLEDAEEEEQNANGGSNA
ncbi:P-loop NTPase fold protein [Paenibacillus sp. FSL R10-2734]|uniref:P-loop NTPase fold protein n=1 Tax=Paenibacillus sp. FSL R10-2734 TaxID=2954691 RepID=UPI0030DBFB31